LGFDFCFNKAQNSQKKTRIPKLKGKNSYFFGFSLSLHYLCSQKVRDAAGKESFAWYVARRTEGCRESAGDAPVHGWSDFEVALSAAREEHR
jgi:hypothetical protein